MQDLNRIVYGKCVLAQCLFESCLWINNLELDSCILSVQATRIFRLCFIDLNSKTNRNHFSLSLSFYCYVCMIVAINNQWSEQNGLSKTKNENWGPTLCCCTQFKMMFTCEAFEIHRLPHKYEYIEEYGMEMQWSVLVWILKFYIHGHRCWCLR